MTRRRGPAAGREDPSSFTFVEPTGIPGTVGPGRNTLLQARIAAVVLEAQNLGLTIARRVGRSADGFRGCRALHRIVGTRESCHARCTRREHARCRSPGTMRWAMAVA